MKPAPVRPAELIAALLNIDDNMTASWWGIMWQWGGEGWPVWEWGQSIFLALEFEALDAVENFNKWQQIVCVVYRCQIEMD